MAFKIQTTAGNTEEVYEFLKDVLEHNKKHFEEHSWPRCINFDKDL